MAICRRLTSLATLQATILLPLDTRKVCRGNTIIYVQNFVSKAPSRLTQLIIIVKYYILYPLFIILHIKPELLRTSDWYQHISLWRATFDCYRLPPRKPSCKCLDLSTECATHSGCSDVRYVGQTVQSRSCSLPCCKYKTRISLSFEPPVAGGGGGGGEDKAP